MPDLHDAQQDALDEYDAFNGTEVRTERRQIWLGPPHFRYVMREVVVRDMGRSQVVQASDKEYIQHTNKNEWSTRTRPRDVEEFLRTNGPLSQMEISRRSGIPESSVRRSCRTSPRIVKADGSKWEAV
jgi:hypothetical protein